jgi:hypothetical protein
MLDAGCSMLASIKLSLWPKMKIFDLFSRFSMAKRHTGELYFNLQWLLKEETEYDPMIDADLDVLKGVRFS